MEILSNSIGVGSICLTKGLIPDASVYLGDDVGITFLGDRYSIFTDLNQNEDGTSGTVQLPEGINGTAFLVATNDQYVLIE